VAAVLLLVTLAVVVCLAACDKRARLPDRNVILVSIDSLRFDHVGCYGYPKPTSPRLDAWARNAMRFEFAYATSPWTLPSHASMFTGLYTDAHGVRSARSKLNDESMTLARALSDAGYRTGGVVCAPLLKKKYGMHQGFDFYDTELVGRNALEARVVKAGPRVTNKALAWLDRSGDKPFFLFLHYWDVHYDYNPPAKYAELFNPGYEGPENGASIHDRKDITPKMDKADFRHLVALYDGEIRFTDDALGALFDGLRERGLDRNTAILIVSDHGEEFLDHGWKGHTRTCYEEVVRIPFLIEVPWLEKARGVSQEAVSLVDIFPTVLGLLGRPKEGLTLQGVDLNRLLTHGTPPAPRSLMAGTQRGQPVPEGKAYEWSTLIARDRQKLHALSGRRFDEQWVFDLRNDPGEKTDISGGKPALTAKLVQENSRRQRLHKRLQKALKTSGEFELDAELAETLKGLGYLN